MGYKGTRVPLFYRGNCQGDPKHNLMPTNLFLVSDSHWVLSGSAIEGLSNDIERQAYG